MSNVPTLLRQCAEGLRKEASDKALAAEASYYAACELVKAAAADTDTLDRAHQAAMLDAARRQAAAMEHHGIESAIANRLSRLSPEDVDELKRKLAAMEGYNTSFNSAMREAPVSTGLRAGVGGVAGAGLGMLLGVGPVGLGVVGATAGAISGRLAKADYANSNYFKPNHLSKGEAVRDSQLQTLSKTDVERKLREWGHEHDSQFGVEDEFESYPEHRTFYKQAGFAALQELQAQGAIRSDVAAAALLELNRRLSQ